MYQTQWYQESLDSGKKGQHRYCSMHNVNLHKEKTHSRWSTGEVTLSCTGREKQPPFSGVLVHGWLNMAVVSFLPLWGLPCPRQSSAHRTCTYSIGPLGYMQWLFYRRYGAMETFSLTVCRLYTYAPKIGDVMLSEV